MSAHIESILGEINSIIKKINKNDLNEIIKTKENIKKFLSTYSITFKTYMYYFDYLNNFIDIPESLLFMQINKKDKDNILSKLNSEKHKHYNFHHYIRYWHHCMNTVINNVVSLLPKWIDDNFI